MSVHRCGYDQTTQDTVPNTSYHRCRDRRGRSGRRYLGRSDDRRHPHRHQRRIDLDNESGHAVGVCDDVNDDRRLELHSRGRGRCNDHCGRREPRVVTDVAATGSTGRGNGRKSMPTTNEASRAVVPSAARPQDDSARPLTSRSAGTFAQHSHEPLFEPRVCVAHVAQPVVGTSTRRLQGTVGHLS
jgi:hypothetical protein